MTSQSMIIEEKIDKNDIDNLTHIDQPQSGWGSSLAKACLLYTHACCTYNVFQTTARFLLAKSFNSLHIFRTIFLELWIIWNVINPENGFLECERSVNCCERWLNYDCHWRALIKKTTKNNLSDKTRILKQWLSICVFLAFKLFKLKNIFGFTF